MANLQQNVMDCKQNFNFFPIMPIKNAREVDMETTAIAGAAMMMTQAKTQEGISMMALKQATESQNQVANMLAQQVQQLQPDTSYGFSAYA